jgi:hypothetical protein
MDTVSQALEVLSELEAVEAALKGVRECLQARPDFFAEDIRGLGRGLLEARSRLAGLLGRTRQAYHEQRLAEDDGAAFLATLYTAEQVSKERDRPDEPAPGQEGGKP